MTFKKIIQIFPLKKSSLPIEDIQYINNLIDKNDFFLLHERISLGHTITTEQSKKLGYIASKKILSPNPRITKTDEKEINNLSYLLRIAVLNKDVSYSFIKNFNSSLEFLSQLSHNQQFNEQNPISLAISLAYKQYNLDNIHDRLEFNITHNILSESIFNYFNNYIQNYLQYNEQENKIYCFPKEFLYYYLCKNNHSLNESIFQLIDCTKNYKFPCLHHQSLSKEQKTTIEEYLDSLLNPEGSYIKNRLLNPENKNFMLKTSPIHYIKEKYPFELKYTIEIIDKHFQILERNPTQIDTQYVLNLKEITLEKLKELEKIYSNYSEKQQYEEFISNLYCIQEELFKTIIYTREAANKKTLKNKGV
jgi:hypothetical protein